MRVSLGTARVLGLKKVKIDALPTTAYLMYGEGCRRNCKFCAQAKKSGADSRMLSRVIWPEFEVDRIMEGVKKARNDQLFKRLCIQVVDDGNEEELISVIKKFADLDLPLCISKSVNEIEEIERLLSLGVDRVSVAIDCATPEIFKRIKGGSFEQRLNLLIEAARKFPHRIGTHIIAGLGETEEEIIELMARLASFKINTALFAFTPIKGTPLENNLSPLEDFYRRIQIAHYLIKEAQFTFDDFVFINHRLMGFARDEDDVLKLLLNGNAFMTSGCLNCNRPYYNERPGGVIYNYPRRLTGEETYKALKKSGLWSVQKIYIALKHYFKDSGGDL